jgi:hypothetical protein
MREIMKRRWRVAAAAMTAAVLFAGCGNGGGRHLEDRRAECFATYGTGPDAMRRCMSLH